MDLSTEMVTAQKSHGFEYQGEALRHVAMPLGGLGTGQVALGGDGGLRQWQIVNQVNHLGFIPDSFFALRACCTEPPLNVIRILQSREILERGTDHTPLVNDDHIPPEQLELLQHTSGVERTRFTGAYPFATIAYEDEQLPVEVTLEAFSPFIPLDAQASGLPAILFTFTLRNRGQHNIHGCLGGTLQNAVGWDGVTPIAGNRCSLYGGNVNRLRKKAGYTAIVMDNVKLPDDHPGMGQMVLTSLSSHTRAFERWTDPTQFIRFIEGLNTDHHLASHDYSRQRSYKNGPALPAGPSPTGETWNGGLLVSYWLKPGESTTISFIISWYFPNRYVNFDQFGPRRDYGRSRFWLGNEYATRFSDAVDVAEYFIANRTTLEDRSRAWSEGIFSSTLPAWMQEAIAAQGTLLRSPTSFWTEDGKFFGFEGSLGASTNMWNGDFGGSCPLNCTHVWNYEQALSRLFPRLEQTMRETDLEHAQAPEGYIPHRTALPLYLPQFWNVGIGGPTNPALDGMLGTVLKVYREVRQGAGRAWLNRYWPRVERLIEYIIARWDPEQDGVLEGEQPNTYDIAFYGPNMYIGGLWLAALRAGEELAKLQHETRFASDLRRLFEAGSARYDELLWNGEYYIQLIDQSTPLEDQFGEGCLADQLFGQWWAHQLELGYILPEEHVKTTLRAIVRYNFQEGFRGFEHGYRVFADRDDAGLLVCTWPRGGRPEIPVRYCDEVWTGIEYQVGTHCIMEGLVDEGLKVLAAVRQRYDGKRRNPYNEIECGDHYARAMAGWSMLEAMSGFHCNALEDALTFAPVGDANEFRAPFITGTSWGVYSQRSEHTCIHVELACSFGELQIQRLTLKACANIVISTETESVPFSRVEEHDGLLTLAFEPRVMLQPGRSLTLLLKRS
ncbi:MAG TPA: GH116 family glycosyl-hydrolase [Ktedonosporobacter sp.]|nr:GH116 family glycosyl-hydrolase [Ktedonosporobacter sp.]